MNWNSFTLGVAITWIFIGASSGLAVRPKGAPFIATMFYVIVGVLLGPFAAYIMRD